VNVEQLAAVNLSALEMALEDLREQIEEDRALLGELTAGNVDVRVLLRRWIERAIRDEEGRERDLADYLTKVREAVLAPTPGDKSTP
jgi:hypothetical protein